MGIAGTVPRSRHFVNIYFYINMSKFQIVVTYSFRLASRPIVAEISVMGDEE